MLVHPENAGMQSSITSISNNDLFIAISPFDTVIIRHTSILGLYLLLRFNSKIDTGIIYTNIDPVAKIFPTAEGKLYRFRLFCR